MSTREQHANEHMMEQLFKRYYRPLVVFANDYVHCLEEAEDIVQEQFAKLWNGGQLSRVEAPAVSTFLFTVIRNACLNFIEKRRLPLTGLDPLHHQIAAQEAEAMDDEQAASVRAALSRLPERTRQVVERVVIHDESYQEAAETLGVSINTVKTLLRLGMKELRERVDRRGPLSRIMYYVATRFQHPCF